MRAHPASGNGFAIAVLLLGTIWMALRVSGLFNASPIPLPAWAGGIVALGVLTGPASVVLLQSSHWIVRLVMFIMFAGCVFIFPWFYDQFPLYFWLTILLVYVEVFWAIPVLLKRRKSSP